tara:strand:+ start:391 stop:1152 length:762 start_codon:yes stop_codon:yes gene_type:complete
MENILDHLVNKIKSAELIDQPFVHKFIENIFPDEFYENLLLYLPKKEQYTAINKTGWVGGNYSPERYVFNLLDENNFNLIEQPKKEFLKNFTNLLISKDLFNFVTFIFKDQINHRLNNLSNLEIEQIGSSNYKFSVVPMLVKDFTKYNLGAHTDHYEKLVSFLFYLPNNNELKNIGTALYKPNIKIEDDQLKQHFSAEDTKKIFTKIKTCPFIPNSLFIFPRTQNSFHGVEEVNIEKKERNLLQLNYYIKKNS